MMKTEEVARLTIDGAEIQFDRGRQRWQVAGQDVRNSTLFNWKGQGIIDRDFTRTHVTLDYYLLTEEGKQRLIWIYFPEMLPPDQRGINGIL